jgi:hypothetical protein
MLPPDAAAKPWRVDATGELWYRIQEGTDND